MTLTVAPVTEQPVVKAARTCPKCGNEARLEWHAAEDWSYYLNQGRNSACEGRHGVRGIQDTMSLTEHLHLSCSCGYVWSAAPLDSEKTEAAS